MELLKFNFRKMKILTIAATPFFSGRGGHMRIYNEAKYLGELGAEVRLCTYHLGENIPGIDIVRIKGPKSYKKTSPGFSWGKIWLDWKMIFLVRREIKKFQPDVIHAHLWEGLAVGYLAKKIAFKKIPVVFDLQGDLEEEFRSYNGKNSFARKFFVWLSKIVIGWADKIIVSSENVNPMLSLRGIPPWRETAAIPGLLRCARNDKKIEIIRDGIDLDLFKHPAELSNEEREKIDKIKKWAGDSRLLVYIGGLSDNKGVGNLLEAFGSAVSRNYGWKLLVGGFGRDEKKYKQYVADNKLEGSVHFAGKIGYFSLPHYLALADAGIDPKSESTESSGKLANLMAGGLAVICFDNGFNRARLGEKGFYLNNINDLGNLLKSVESEEKINYDLSELSEEKEAEKILKVFNSLIK